MFKDDGEKDCPDGSDEDDVKVSCEDALTQRDYFGAINIADTNSLDTEKCEWTIKETPGTKISFNVSSYCYLLITLFSYLTIYKKTLKFWGWILGKSIL